MGKNRAGMSVSVKCFVSTELNVGQVPDSVIKRGSTKADPLWKWEARNLGEQKPKHLSEERKWGLEEARGEAETQGLGGGGDLRRANTGVPK